VCLDLGHLCDSCCDLVSAWSRKASTGPIGPAIDQEPVPWG
jgi:hypothetical protein